MILCLTPSRGTNYSYLYLLLPRRNSEMKKVSLAKVLEFKTRDDDLERWFQDQGFLNPRPFDSGFFEDSLYFFCQETGSEVGFVFADWTARRGSAKRQDIPRTIMHSLSLHFDIFLFHLHVSGFYFQAQPGPTKWVLNPSKNKNLLSVFPASCFFALPCPLLAFPFCAELCSSYILSYNTEPVPRGGQNNVRVTRIRVEIV